MYTEREEEIRRVAYQIWRKKVALKAVLWNITSRRKPY
jgi:hypothetical protein